MSASLRAAGALWLLAGLCYLTAETIAAAGYTGYSYAHNYISDLGVPGESPRMLVMNLGAFILDGLLFGAAALVLRPSGRQGAWFVALAIIHAIGTILVGSIHSGPEEIAAGIHHWHVIGAAMAIIGGNLALIAAAGTFRRYGVPSAYRRICLFLGTFGLLNIIMLEANRVLGTTILPDGVFERGAVYPITAWEVLTGLALLTIGRQPRERVPG